MANRMEGYRGQGGKLDAYVWPGGYPLFYLTDHCVVLCPACATETDGIGDDPPVTADVNWEDPDLYCEDCGKRIESAYAEKE